MEKKVNYILAVRSLRQKKVGIYCRVSTKTVKINSWISLLQKVLADFGEIILICCKP